jgi:hypothetical protein
MLDQQNNLHQTIFGAVYLSDIARTNLTQTKPLIYREGAVIVRERLQTEAGSPELLTAMINRKKGFNPAANDWEFLVLSGDTTQIRKREKTGDCQSCHKSASAKDFVFDSYLPVGRQAGGPAKLQFGLPELAESHLFPGCIAANFRSSSAASFCNCCIRTMSGLRLFTKVWNPSSDIHNSAD